MSKTKPYSPQILVFSTDKISDPGIDLAGQQHIHYSPCACCIVVPCSSGIKPQWILHALKQGFDGVFVAADGTDCPYLPDCSERTAALVGKTQEMMKAENIDPKRLKMAAICSVCADSFAKHISNFTSALLKLGPPQT
ncbi:MAG: hydrogenase iron-sulfur subunit [Bacteroidales bacterium]